MRVAVATHAVNLGLEPDVVWNTPWQTLEDMMVAKQRSKGQSFRRRLEPEEASIKDDSLAWHKARLAKR